MNHEWLKKSCKVCLSFRPCIYFNFGFFFICSHLGFSISYSTLLCFQVVVIVVVLGFIIIIFVTVIIVVVNMLTILVLISLILLFSLQVIMYLY